VELKTKSWASDIFPKIIKSGLLVYLILLVLLIIAEIVSPGFLSFHHLGNVLRQASFLGIVAIGQTFVILSGGIDLSVASIITLANVVSAQIMDGSNGNLLLALITVIAIGAVVGLANGSGVCFLKIPPLIMTLGVGSVVQGIALVYSKGAPKGYAAPLVRFISNEKIGGLISGAVILWLILGLITILILKYTTFGRNVYAIGTNVVAARYSGVNITRVTLSIYILSGIMSAITGTLLVGYTGTSFLDAGTAYTMNSIAAVVVGGTSIIGGRGGYGGTIAGAIIMTIIGSLLTIVHIPESGRQIAQGLIILCLVLIYGREKTRG